MDGCFVNLTLDNLSNEHLCCAIADKKHQCGVDVKKAWLAERIPEGHVFRKLNERGKVFIEYAPLEKAWVPVVGDGYLYIYCLWVSGSFKGQGYGKDLLEYCVDDAKRQGKSGVCVLSSKKKKPFLTEKKFMQKYGFVTVDTVGEEYELLALSLDGSLPRSHGRAGAFGSDQAGAFGSDQAGAFGSDQAGAFGSDQPRFTERAKQQRIENQTLTVYYGLQCPYIPDCIEQIESHCRAQNIPLELVKVDTLEKAKALPCVFNNWAVFYKGSFETVHLLNEGYLKKLLG